MSDELAAAYRHIFGTTVDLAAVAQGSFAFLGGTSAWKELGYATPEALTEALNKGVRMKLPPELRRGLAMQLAADGHTQRQIADELGVSVGTVNADIQNRTPKAETEHEDRPDVFSNEPWTPSPGLMSSDSPEWYTPKHIVAAVVSALDGIDLDPCADPDRSVPADLHYTERDDGLAQPWRGSVFMNPPYGRPIGTWVAKLVAEYRAERVTAAVALVPARTETDWWAAFDARLVCFIHGRLAFSGQETSAPFPSAAIYLGSNEQDFVDAFAPLGEVYRRVP